MRLGPAQRIVHDDDVVGDHAGSRPMVALILTTNTRAGFLSTDIYSIDLASGARRGSRPTSRGTNTRTSRPTGVKDRSDLDAGASRGCVSALTAAGISPLYDFFLWIVLWHLVRVPRPNSPVTSSELHAGWTLTPRTSCSSRPTGSSSPTTNGEQRRQEVDLSFRAVRRERRDVEDPPPHVRRLQVSPRSPPRAAGYPYSWAERAWADLLRNGMAQSRLFSVLR